MPQTAREGADLGVITLDRRDEVATGHRDPVFRAFKLGLQREEVLVGFEVRIALRDHHQAAQCAGQLTLCVLELLEFGWIVQRAGVHLNRRRLGPRFDNSGQGVLLLLGVALHRFHQIGDQVGAALILVLHLCPGSLDLLVVSRNVVDPAAGQQGRQQQHQRQ